MGALEEIDVSVAAGTWKVKAAAALMGMTGLFLGFTGLQLFTIHFRNPALELVPWAHLNFAAALVVLAAMTYRARTWAAIAGTLIGALALLGASVWQLYGMAHGIFSLLGLLSVPAALCATILGAIAIGDARAATKVRRQLADEGMNIGL
jgi:hypothetical protein